VNPNNCSTCDHIKNPDGGHCYMFRTEPDEVCMQHTLRKVIVVGSPTALSLVLAAALIGGGESIDEDIQKYE